MLTCTYLLVWVQWAALKMNRSLIKEPPQTHRIASFSPDPTIACNYDIMIVEIDVLKECTKRIKEAMSITQS